MKILWLLTRIGFYLFAGGLFICLPIEGILNIVNKISAEPKITASLVFSGLLLILLGLNPWHPLPTAKPYYQSKTVWAICWWLLVVALIFGLPYEALGLKVLLPFFAVPMFLCLPFAIWEVETGRRSAKKLAQTRNV